jgi:hypothetical protein
MIVYANGRVIATDTDGDTQPVGVVGAQQDTLKVADDESRDLLFNVIQELRILNMHMTDMTDNVISKEDVEV